MKIFLIMFLLNTIDSKIVIDIIADNINPTINFSGSGVQKATARNMGQHYFIDNITLKEYVSSYFNNTKPRKVLYSTSSSKTKLSDETQTNSNIIGVHERYKLEPVVLISTVKSAQKKDVHEGKSIYLSKQFKNPTNTTKIVNAGIAMPVAITLDTAWYATPFIEPDYELDHDIVYDINVIFKKNSGTTGITHTTTLGKPSQVHELVTIGQSNYEIELKPGQAVVAKFSAKVCNLVMKAVILTSVSGNLAVNFKEVVNGRHWLGPKIEDILEYVNGSSISPIKEHLVIRLDYYFDAKVEIFDKETGELL